MSSISLSNRRAKKERLVKLLRLKKAARGKRDLWFFDKYILGYSDMTEQSRFHGEMCHFVEKVKKHVLLLEPRGSLKTSCVTIGYTVQSIINDPNIRILICSEEFNTAVKFLTEIKGHFEDNKLLRELYGDFVGDSKWSEKEIIVSKRTRRRKEPTVTAAGIDVTKVGLHYDLIIIDDPHSSKNITTREQIEKVKTWYKLVLSLLDPGKKIIVIGTRWHYDDLFGWLIEQERIREAQKRKPKFRIVQKDAILKGDLNEHTKKRNLLWPERLSRSFLLDQKLDQGPYIFSCQYRNRPVDDESATFKRSWVRFYDPKKLPDDLLTFTTVDPMIDEEGRDYAAVVTCGVDPHWTSYVLEVRRGKWDEYDCLDQIIRAWQRWGSVKIGIESVAWQKLFYRFVRRELKQRGLKRMPIVELKTDSRIKKQLRIKGMVPYWKSGLFRVPGVSIPLLKGNMAILVDELTRYPKVSNDDTVDALAYMSQLMRTPAVSLIRKTTPPGSFDDWKKRKAKKNSHRGAFNLI